MAARVFFATILLTDAPSKVTSVTVLVPFVMLGIYLKHCYIARSSWASLATLVAYHVAFISLGPLSCNILTAYDSDIVYSG